MKSLLMLGILLVSPLAMGQVRDEVVVSSQSEIRKFILNPHNYIYSLAATAHLERSSLASDVMRERLKEFLTGSYHMSRISTGSTVKRLRINLSDFNRKDSDDRIFVHFEYTDDWFSDQYYHSKYVTFSGGTGAFDKRQINIKNLDACREYHTGHALACK